MKRVICLIGCYLLLNCGQVALAQNEEKDKASSANSASAQESAIAKEESEFQQLKKKHAEIIAEWENLQGELVKSLEGKSDEEQNKLIEAWQEKSAASQKSANEVLKKAVGLLESIEDGEGKFKVLEWLMENVRDEESQDLVAETLLANFLTSEKAGEVIPDLARGIPSEAQIKVFDKFANEGVNERVKGIATFAKLELTKQAKEIAPLMGDEANETMKQLAEISDEELVASLKAAAERFGEYPYRKLTIEKIAQRYIKTIENAAKLKVGAVAPEIEGVDLDGVNFKLSDYRGKVVMLDFWGDW